MFDGATGALVREFMAYAPAFTGGVFVAVADVNHDNFDDIVVGSGAGGGPHVKVISGRDSSVLQSCFAYGPSFTGGVSVASADLDRDGFADVITGAGAGGGPHVRVISGRTGGDLASFFAFAPAFTGGVFVAAGDVTGDGHADVIVGTRADQRGARGAGVRRRWLAMIRDWWSARGCGGVRVAARTWTEWDLRHHRGPRPSSRLRRAGLVLHGVAGGGTFTAYDPSFLGGVYVDKH